MTNNRTFRFIQEEVVICNTTSDGFLTKGKEYTLISVHPIINTVTVKNDAGVKCDYNAICFDVINKFKKGDISTALIGLGKPFHMTEGKDYEVLDVLTVRSNGQNLQHILITMDDGEVDSVHVDNFYDKSNLIMKQVIFDVTLSNKKEG